jgi:4-amino-4-deoxy-L-arabinose transferase-like glycosyltransferase
MVFAALVTLSLTGFHRWHTTVSESDGAAAGARAVCYLAAAGAVLAKGPAGLLLPALVIVAFLAWERQLALLLRLWSGPLLVLLLGLDLGWYWLAYRAGGMEFVTTQLLRENRDRFLGGGAFPRRTGPLSLLRMVVTLATQYLPWNLALVDGARRALRGEAEDPAGRFLHTWWIVILSSFTIASGKRPVYLLPLAPAIALLAARTLARVLDGAVSKSRWRPLVAMTIVLAPLAALVLSQAVRHHHARRKSLATFAAVVGEHLPASAPLFASGDLGESERLVLAYRLGRRIDRLAPGCTGGGYILVPEPHSIRLVQRQYRLLASSGLPRAAVALIHEPDDNVRPTSAAGQVPDAPRSTRAPGG